jgi:hypothetical protein
MHRAGVFTSRDWQRWENRLSPDTDLRQALSWWCEVAPRIVTKLFDAMWAAEKIGSTFEFDRCCRRVFVDGHSAYGINRVSAINVSMTVIHFSVD